MRDGVRPGVRAEFGVAADPETSILAATWQSDWPWWRKIIPHFLKEPGS